MKFLNFKKRICKFNLIYPLVITLNTFSALGQKGCVSEYKRIIIQSILINYS